MSVARHTPPGQPPSPAPEDGPSTSQPRRPAGTVELFRAFFLIGLTSFGMAILQNIRSVSVKRGWLSQEEIDEGLGLVQLFPGAIMMDLVAYIGYRARRLSGALAATAGFIAPSLLLMLALSWAYRRYGAVAGVRELVTGLDAVVVGVVASIALDFAAQHARGRLEATLAVAAFAVGVAGVNALWAVLAALVAGALGFRGRREDQTAPEAGRERVSRRALAWSLAPAVVVAAGAAAAALATGAAAALTADMAKIGTVAFGNGSTILPILQQDAVGVHHWVTAQAFGVGIAFGQITPGPFLITAAFVGFSVAGWWGGVLAAVAIFAPSVAMTTVAAEIYPYLRRLTWVRGAIRGIMAAFTGLLATVVITLGHHIVGVPAALVLAAGALAAVRVFKWNMLIVFGAGLATWAIYLALTGAI
jgi:chromate transporter